MNNGLGLNNGHILHKFVNHQWFKVISNPYIYFLVRCVRSKPGTITLADKKHILNGNTYLLY